VSGLPRRVSVDTAPHYTWGDGCDGWHLVAADGLSVIEERMPPGTAEVRHRHDVARQFFFVLSGALTLEIDRSAAARRGCSLAPSRCSAIHHR
jgi:quercetin dioxygenase-like cupin family protein